MAFFLSTTSLSDDDTVIVREMCFFCNRTIRRARCVIVRSREVNQWFLLSSGRKKRECCFNIPRCVHLVCLLNIWLHHVVSPLGLSLNYVEQSHWQSIWNSKHVPVIGDWSFEQTRACKYNNNKKKEAKSQWEKEIRSRSPSDSSLTVCKFCFFLSSSSLLSDQPAVWFHSVHFLSWGTHHSFFSASYASGIIGSQIRGTPPSTSHGKRFDAPEFLALPLDGRVPHSGEKEDRELFFLKDKN